MNLLSSCVFVTYIVWISRHNEDHVKVIEVIFIYIRLECKRMPFKRSIDNIQTQFRG